MANAAMHFSTRHLPCDRGLKETKVALMQMLSPTPGIVRFITDYASHTSSTINHLSMIFACQAKYHLDIGLGRGNVDSLFICRGMHMPIEILDDVEL
jgi:hypothetical protein